MKILSSAPLSTVLQMQTIMDTSILPFLKEGAWLDLKWSLDNNIKIYNKKDISWST